jgi:hypothetical protein
MFSTQCCVMGGEGTGVHGDSFWAPEAGEGVSTPASEMDGVEGEVGPIWKKLSVLGQESFGVSECVEAGFLLAVRGERLAMGRRRATNEGVAVSGARSRGRACSLRHSCRNLDSSPSARARS